MSHPFSKLFNSTSTPVWLNIHPCQIQDLYMYIIKNSSFYFILFYFILFYFILFYFILFYFILFYFILFYYLFIFLIFFFNFFSFFFTSFHELDCQNTWKDIWTQQNTLDDCLQTSWSLWFILIFNLAHPKIKFHISYWTKVVTDSNLTFCWGGKRSSNLSQAFRHRNFFCFFVFLFNLIGTLTLRRKSTLQSPSIDHHVNELQLFPIFPDCVGYQHFDNKYCFKLLTINIACMYLNGSQLAKAKKYIPYMSLP